MLKKFQKTSHLKGYYVIFWYIRECISINFLIHQMEGYMKKIITSIALAGMLAGIPTVGMVHANSLDQTEKFLIESNHVKSQVIAEDDFASEYNSVFRFLSHGASISNGELALHKGGLAISKNIKVEVGKTYRIILKKVKGDVFTDTIGKNLNDLRYWEDYNNHGNDISHDFIAKNPYVLFVLVGQPDTSLQGFVLKQID